MDDILTLAEAAEALGLASPAGLRVQVHRGKLQGRLIGKTWVVTRAEVERYRRQSLGQVGRPVGRSPLDDGLGTAAPHVSELLTKGRAVDPKTDRRRR